MTDLGRQETAGQRLRRLLDAPGVLRAPGCFDPVSARLVERAGFPVAYMSGAATSAVALGQPDLGHAGLTDMVSHARRLTEALRIPLVADADTGYGNPLHVRRTIQAYEQAGVAAVHLEDQVAPKRCGHMAGKEVVPAAEMAAKIRAASDARHDLVVIARSDAFAIEGLDGAIARGRAYRDAGADLLFLEGVTDPEALRAASSALDGTGLVLNCTEADPSVAQALPEGLEEYGVRIVIYPVAALLAAARAVSEVLTQIRRTGHPSGVPRLGWDDINDLLELDVARRLEADYRVLSNQT